MEVNIVNLSNESVGKVTLNPLIFCVKYRADILRDVVNWQLDKRRAGTHKAKTIADVSGTTAKPHQQKRTGRARQGSLRSPQFRGGAVIFGPVVRSHAYSLNKKVRSLGLKVALSLKNFHNKLLILDEISDSLNKTSEMLKYTSNFGHSSFLIVADYSVSAKLACRNLHNVNVMKPAGINVFDILRHDCVMLSTGALKHLEERLL